ncbi:MAG: hypothetical protein OCU12_07845 [Methanophagales archaeon]|nr:hypothetical protein [Methanophagales archaeon]
MLIGADLDRVGLPPTQPPESANALFRLMNFDTMYTVAADLHYHVRQYASPTAARAYNLLANHLLLKFTKETYRHDQ